MNEIKKIGLQNANDSQFKEVISYVCEWWVYFKPLIGRIILLSFFAGILGFFYAKRQPILYTSKVTFVVEEGKNSGNGLGGLASLAGQFGVDVSSSSGGSVLSGENILLYFKSESLAREVLLSYYDSSANLSIADKYSEVYKLNKDWEKIKNLNNISFPIAINGYTYSRIQDSLLQIIINKIINFQFNII